MGVITKRIPQFFSGVEADRATVPTAKLLANDIYFSTDTPVLYRWDGAAWQGPVPADWITALMLKTDSVETLKIKDLNVTEGKLAPLACAEAKIGNLSISAGKLQTDSCETLKIKDLNITEGKLGPLACAEAKIGNLSISAGKLQTDSVETIKIKDGNVTFAKLADDAMGDFGHKLLHIQDQKASGVAGGTFTTGAWRIRDLNVALTNEIAGASLAANQITLPAGDYFIIASGPAYAVGQHKIKVRNFTDGADVLIGTTEFGATGDIQTRSFVSGRFTLGAEKVLELHHRSGATQALNGFGADSTFAVIEVYSDVMIWKV